MAGSTSRNVVGIISGANAFTRPRFARFDDRFAPFDLSETTMRPSYGLAEATVYVATAEPCRAPRSSGSTTRSCPRARQAVREREAGGGTELVSYGRTTRIVVRIVDPDTGTENPAGTIGEIWVHGENVAMGYWRKPQQTQRTSARSWSTRRRAPEGPWLRTGDLGVMSDGELFIIGRIKDLLIVDGRNHYPDDIEATIQEITGGRVAAISVPDDRTEQLVAIIELKNRGDSARGRAWTGFAWGETPGHVGDFAVAQPAGRRSRPGAARLDTRSPRAARCGARHVWSITAVIDLNGWTFPRDCEHSR